ncbi:MAG: hypothetical protein H0X37_17720 [Herpetosiphonaceae bacterium]|nr:hypothetical protein [Herpetosiphonaceae bacterium]
MFALLLKQLGDTKQTLAEVVVGTLLFFIALSASFWMLLRAWRPPASIELPLEQQAEPHAGLVLLVSEGQQKSVRAAIDCHTHT